MVISVEAASGLGMAYGVYEALRALGFGWLHPMEVITPVKLDLNTTINLDVKRSPWLATRGSHVHAEHPNELCDVLNG